jgi:hypothetical protein
MPSWFAKLLELLLVSIFLPVLCFSKSDQDIKFILFFFAGQVHTDRAPDYMIYQLPKRLRRMAPGPASPSSGCPIPDDVLFFQILVLLPVKCILRKLLPKMQLRSIT